MTSTRHLAFENLELRLALSSQSVLDGPLNLDHPFATAFELADPAARAAIANITTTGSQEWYHVDLPELGLKQSDEVQPSLVQSRDLINLTDFRADPRFAGIDGSGFSVVILDTGIDLNHPFFGPDLDLNGVADRIVYNQDFITGGPNADDVNGHGTHVSSTIASQDATFSGMAPGVNIIQLKVLNDFGGGTGAALESALQWVVANAATYNVASINMSLGFGTNDAAPDPFTALGINDELAAIVAQNVIVASASGNSFFGFGSAPGVSYPSSDPSSLSVGAVWDASVGSASWGDGATDFTTGPDRIVSFSQRHPAMSTIFAPGAYITAGVPGGGADTYSGTSMATPHIAGIAAIMQELAMQETGQRLSQAEFAALINHTGVPIYDGDDENDNVANTQEWYRRVDVLALANAILSDGEGDITIPSGLTMSSPTASPGGIANLGFILANQGAGATGTFSSGIYLSTDSNVDSSDLLLTSFGESLDPGEVAVHSAIAAAIPEGLLPGLYHIGLVVDRLGEVDEVLETNNVASLPLTVTAASPEIRLVALPNSEIVDGVSTVNFGTIDQGMPNVERTFRLFNDGPTELTLNSLEFPASFDVIGLPTAVAGLSTVDFTIAMLGSAAPGNATGPISFVTNDLDETTFNFTLQGTINPPDDHGDNASEATSVPSIPATETGVIAPSGDVDWFSFSAIAGVKYRFTTTLLTLSDSVIRLVAPDGVTTIAVNDDSILGLASLIDWTATSSDVYFLEVRGFSSSVGAYNVNFNIQDDHGNYAGAATASSDPSSVSGVLGTVDDTDWFSFAAVDGTTYSFATMLGTLPDSVLRVWDVDGTTLLASDDDGGAGLASLLTWTATKDGVYYIDVSSYAAASSGTYTLSITGDDDHGDNAPNATQIDVPGTIGGEIEVPFDVDWFKFDAISGARYQFATTLGTLTDSVLRLRDANGLLLATDDDGGPGLASFIDWIPSLDGTYYLEVSGLNWRSGSYDLSMTIVDDHGNNTAGATAVLPAVFTAGVIAPSSDVDWFSFNASAGVEYELLTTLGTLDDSVLRLIGTDGVTLIAKDDDSGPGLASLITWTPTVSGVYFLEVRGFDAGVGTYSVLVLPKVDLVVDEVDDELDGVFSADDLSLREAVLLAGAYDKVYGNSPVITFAPPLHGQTIALTLGELMIDRSMTILGPGAGLLTIAGMDPTPGQFNGDGSRAFFIDSFGGSDVELRGLTVTGGDVNGSGGAIFATGNLKLSRAVVTGGSASFGGGGVAQFGGSLEILESTVSGNQSFNGGGLYATNGASLLVERSTISGNTASGEGGGIWSASNLAGPLVARVTNSTVSGNYAAGAGGGIRNWIGLLNVEHSTVTGNTSTSGAGISSYGLNDTRTDVYSSIVADNNGADVEYTPTSFNSFLSLGYNLVGDGNATSAFNNNDLVGADPWLATLADNGGPTWTHALLPVSPAINAGDPGYAGPLAFDQRGVPHLRAQGVIDIGAFELQETEIPTELDLVLDNDDGAATYSETGAWTTATATGYNGLTYRFSSVGSAATAQWRFHSPFSGAAEVFVQHRAGSNRASNAAFKIDTGDGIETAYVNQKNDLLTWVSLGEFYLNQGLRTITLDAAASSGGSVVLADAVWIVMTASPEPTADFDDDGWIDGNDFLLWQRGVATSAAATLQQGDADHNGQVDGADLAVWRDQFGASSTAVAATNWIASSQLVMSKQSISFSERGIPDVSEMAATNAIRTHSMQSIVNAAAAHELNQHKLAALEGRREHRAVLNRDIAFEELQRSFPRLERDSIQTLGRSAQLGVLICRDQADDGGFEGTGRCEFALGAKGWFESLDEQFARL
jgi:hypothetical protein